MESLIYSDTRLGRLGKRPLTRPLYLTLSMVLPFRHGITTIRTCVHNYRHVKRFVVFNQTCSNLVSKHRLDAQGPRYIDFLVFRNKSLKEAYGPIVAKWNELN